ncbi:MAG: BrnA antitoxin family protein [Nitrospirae bacterium]|nr:BrnA antitoxin family protein [Nitrospirota bacterium]
MKKERLKEHDKYELPDEVDFSGKEVFVGRFYRPKKVSTTLRLDNDVIFFFKKLATAKKTGYQTLIGEALREYVKHHLKSA